MNINGFKKIKFISKSLKNAQMIRNNFLKKQFINYVK